VERRIAGVRCKSV